MTSGRDCLRAATSARVRARMSSRIMTRASSEGAIRRRVSSTPSAPPPASTAAAFSVAARKPGAAPLTYSAAPAVISTALRAASGPLPRNTSQGDARVVGGVPPASPAGSLSARPKSAGRSSRVATLPSASSATNVAPAGANSSSPPAPCTTSARRDAERAERARQRLARARARRRRRRACGRRRVGQRPEQVEDVREAELLARAGGVARRRVERGANRKPMPASRRQRADSAGAGVGVDARAPRARRATPACDDSARLPCLATATAARRDHERGERRDVDRAARRRRRCRRCRPPRSAVARRAASARRASRAPRRRSRRRSRPSCAARSSSAADLRRRRLRRP